MKISIITLHAVSNYGSVLQTVATDAFWKEMGLEVEFLNYKREDCRSIALFLRKEWYKKPNILFPIKALIYLPTLIRWKFVFDRFIKDNIKTTEKVYTYEEDFSEIPDADIYCTGSDQVWNSKLNNGILGMFYLDYVPDNKKRISFAASFGKDTLDEWEKRETKSLLSKYDYITVREKSGVDIIKDLGIYNVEQFLDPTLLFGSNHWNKYASDRMSKSKYLFVYQLHYNEGIEQFINEIAKTKGLKVVRLCYRYDEVIKKGKCLIIPKVKDFLGCIKHAGMVITDSFHATAFSVNYNVPFISILPKEQFGGRIHSLLELTGLEDRLIFEDYSVEKACSSVDFTFANKVLDEQRISIRNKFKSLIESWNENTSC